MHILIRLLYALYHLTCANAVRKAKRFGLCSKIDLSISLSKKRKPIKQLSRFGGTIIEGWFGDFLLHGAPELLDLLYQTGLGAKNSEGYGMIDLLDRQSE